MSKPRKAFCPSYEESLDQAKLKEIKSRLKELAMETRDRRIKRNRRIFLKALRSGEYPKGEFIAGQDKPPPGAVGYCAVALPYTLLCGNQGPVIKGLKDKLGLTSDNLFQIQNEWNDSDLTFSQIADLIEHTIFSKEKA